MHEEEAISRVPDWMRERGRAMYALADRTTPVADLELDSLLDVGCGPHLPSRDVRFALGESALAVTVRSLPGSGAFDVDVEMTPPGPFQLRAQHEEGCTFTTESNRDGCAGLSGVRQGFVTFYVACRDLPAPTWRTAWLRY